MILYENTFEICFVYNKKCRDVMSYNFLMKYFTLVISVLSTGIIIYTIRPLSVKPGKNSIFLKNGKTVIATIVQVENLECLYISNDETDFTIGIVSRNLVTQSNFVKFQDIRNFTFFEV